MEDKYWTRHSRHVDNTQVDHLVTSKGLAATQLAQQTLALKRRVQYGSTVSGRETLADGNSPLLPSQPKPPMLMKQLDNRPSRCKKKSSVTDHEHFQYPPRSWNVVTRFCAGRRERATSAAKQKYPAAGKNKEKGTKEKEGGMTATTQWTDGFCGSAEECCRCELRPKAGKLRHGRRNDCIGFRVGKRVLAVATVNLLRNCNSVDCRVSSLQRLQWHRIHPS